MASRPVARRLSAVALTVALAATVQGLAAQSVARALVLHKRANTVGLYDATTGRRLWAVAVGDLPHEMVVSVGERFAYVTNYGVDSWRDTAAGGRTLSVVDLSRAAVARTIDLETFRRPHGIALGLSGRLYVTVDEPAAVLEVDPEAGRVVRTHPLDQQRPHMVAISPDEQTIFAANSGSGTVSIIPRADGSPVAVEVGGVPMGLALSRDGGTLFVATRDGQTVSVIDTRRRRVRATWPVGGGPARLKLTPDDRRLLVTCLESGELIALDPADGSTVGRVAVGPGAEGIAIDYRRGFGYASAQGADRVVKFSLTDWRPVLEIATQERPDPIEILDQSPRTP
jgi:YVTN family beta-propeller protein